MKKEKNNLFNQLGGKISIRVTVIIIALTVLSGIALYNSIKATSEHAIGNFSIETAQNIAKQIDGDKYNDFLQNQSESDLYWDLRRELNDFRTKSGALYVYTLDVTNESDVIVLVDGMPENEIELAADIGEVIDVTTAQDVEPVLNGNGSFSDVVEDPSYGDYLSAFAPITDNSGNVIGILGVDIGADTISFITSDVTKSILPIFIIVILVLTIIAIIFLSRFILKSLRPLQHLQDAANNIADGDVRKADEIINQLPKNNNDEIGKLTESIHNMIDQLKTMIQSISATSENVAASSEELTANTEQSLEINKQIEHAIQQVRTGSNEQLVSTEESAQSMDRITATIHDISENTSITAETSVHTLEETERGQQTIVEISEQMNTISESTSNIAHIIDELDSHSHQIVQIVDIITDIAEQTNLLALNAAIEAARAGEHGQGFAIVSEEIRNLAEQSKSSADQITTLIQTISHDTKQAVTAMNEGKKEAEIGAKMTVTVDQAFQSILDNVTTMTSQVQKVSSSSHEILANSEEVTALINELANVANQTAAMSDEVAHNTQTQLNSTEEVSQSSVALSKITFELQEIVQNFRI